MTLPDPDDGLAAALEECCGRVRRGETLERCLLDYPSEYRAELAHLVPLSLGLAGLARDPLSPFQAELERRLLAAVDEARHSSQPSTLRRIGALLRTSRVLHFASLILAALGLIAAGGVAVVAAEDSLPDSPLYQVQAVREEVELLLAPEEGAQMRASVRQITQRGQELQQALEQRKPQRVTDVVAERMTRTAEQHVARALKRHAQGDPQPAIQALDLLRAMQARVAHAATQAPPDARPRLQRLRGALETQERRLLDLGLAPAGAP